MNNRVTVALVASLLIPWVQKLTGVQLTLDQAVGLVGLSVAAFHTIAVVFVRYFPPPNPTQPAEPAQKQ